MTSKANIFNSLPQHHSDSEDDDRGQTTQTKKTNDRKDNKNTNKNQSRAGGNVPVKTEKEEHARHKDPRQQKGVTSEPHPLDRHSGTGQSAYGAKPKKGGSGKGNWGTDKKPTEDLREDEDRETGEETEEKPQEVQKPELTLQEYYQQRGYSQNEPQVNEAKAKITSEQLMKEMGTATMLKSRQQQQVDDHKVGKKKDRLDVNHHAALNSEHGNLLNFRTGFIEKEYRQRGQDDVGQKKPFQGNRGDRTRTTEEGKQEEAQPVTQATEAGETQPATTEGQATTTEGATEGQDTQNRRRQEGDNQRGGRGGRGGYRGDRPQGDRNQGRKPYGAKADQAKLNVTDESAFPKLG